jgi:hypothetical protein
MRRALPVLLLLAPLAGVVQDASAQQRPGVLTSVRENPAAHPVLTRPIRVAFANVTLDVALAAIADSAGIGISYSPDALPATRIRLGPAMMQAGAALNAVLEGTGLDAFVTAGGNIAIAPALPAPAMQAPPQPPLVRGRILDSGGGRPIAGVFVTLIDAAGDARAAVLSGADGSFALRAPAAGRYALHYEMIGYATLRSPEFVLDAVGALREDAHLAPAAISLQSIRVAAADSRCRLSRDVGLETYRVWDEASKALRVAAWTERDAGVAYQALTSEFSRDLVSGEVLADRPVIRRVTSAIGRTPFVSASADQLATEGFVRSLAGGGYMYYGLDAATLLTSAFLENYCFRVRLPHRDSELVGLGFEPVRRRAAADIAGVLWLDRRTLGLLWLEYHYTTHPAGELPLELFGGRVDFRRLPNGAWIISDWWIRMPESGPPLAPPDLLRGANTAELQALRAAGLTIREAGGSVRYIDLAEAAATGAGSAITGVVYDSTRMRPLRSAVVFAAGTGRIARTDAAGRFELAGLAPGEYSIGFFHPYTDSLALPIALTPVTTSADEVAVASLRVPASAGCPWDDADTVHAVGFVVDRSGTPAPAATVVATWTVSVESAGSITRAAASAARHEARATADGFGRFSLCGLPPSTEVQLQAARSRAVSVQTPGRGLVRQNLVIR